MSSKQAVEEVVLTQYLTRDGMKFDYEGDALVHAIGIIWEKTSGDKTALREVASEMAELFAELAMLSKAESDADALVNPPLSEKKLVNEVGKPLELEAPVEVIEPAPQPKPDPAQAPVTAR